MLYAYLIMGFLPSCPGTRSVYLTNMSFFGSYPGTTKLASSGNLQLQSWTWDLQICAAYAQETRLYSTNQAPKKFSRFYNGIIDVILLLLHFDAAASPIESC